MDDAVDMEEIFTADLEILSPERKQNFEVLLEKEIGTIVVPFWTHTDNPRQDPEVQRVWRIIRQYLKLRKDTPVKPRERSPRNEAAAKQTMLALAGRKDPYLFEAFHWTNATEAPPCRQLVTELELIRIEDLRVEKVHIGKCIHLRYVRDRLSEGITTGKS